MAADRTKSLNDGSCSSMPPSVPQRPSKKHSKMELTPKVPNKHMPKPIRRGLDWRSLSSGPPEETTPLRRPARRIAWQERRVRGQVRPLQPSPDVFGDGFLNRIVQSFFRATRRTGPLGQTSSQGPPWEAPGKLSRFKFKRHQGDRDSPWPGRPAG